MIEAALAWIGLLISVVTNDAQWFMAAGAFAVAAQISRLVDRLERKDGE